MFLSFSSFSTFKKSKQAFPPGTGSKDVKKFGLYQSEILYLGPLTMEHSMTCVQFFSFKNLCTLLYSCTVVCTLYSCSTFMEDGDAVLIPYNHWEK